MCAGGANDGIACTADACEEATDQCTHGANHALCSDGLFCNGTETCSPTAGCQSAPPVSCGDGVGCTLDTCNEITDSCDHVPSAALCSDGLFCNGAEVCLLLADCAAGTPIACSDGISCTVCHRITAQALGTENSFTGNFVTGVWFGNDDYQSLNRMTGGSLPAMTWHGIMAYAHQGIELKPLPGVAAPERKPEPRVAENKKSAEPPPQRPALLTRRSTCTLLMFHSAMSRSVGVPRCSALLDSP